jgi:hypothetical protein
MRSHEQQSDTLVNCDQGKDGPQDERPDLPYTGF